MSEGNGGTGSSFTESFTSPNSGAQKQLGPVHVEKNDPAWQPPSDPLLAPQAKAGATIIYREVPNLAVQSSWSVADVRNALASLTAGLFDQPAQLVDAIIGDDRVQATMGSRSGGLFGRPLKFSASKIPSVDGSDAAKECLDAWRRVWPRTLTEPVLSEMSTWSALLGFYPGQLLWDTSSTPWCPYLRAFHPRYTWYHWILRRYVAVTLDGQVAIEPGDGHWFLHAPHGEYRGWMRGAVRAVAQPWLIRNFAYRDWARYSERHGLPQLIARTPAAGDPVKIDKFRAGLQTIGQEAVIELPQGVDKQYSYDLDLLEASDGAWQGFDGLIRRCEMSIVLALLGQNLSTEVKEGSFAAARVHADVRQSFLEADARSLSQTIYTQIARPFAMFNFGDPDLAPFVTWDVSPIDDAVSSADVFNKIAVGMKALRDGGFKVDNLAEFARAFGLDLDITVTEPVSGGGLGR